MRTKVHEERLVAVPAEQDAQIVVDAECPVGVEVALQLVRPKERVLRVGHEARSAARSIDTCGSRSFLTVRRKRLEAVSRKSAPKLVEQLLDVGETWRLAGLILGLRLADLAN